MLSDRDALMRAIIADPDDDVAHLVLADWLEEHGDDVDRVRAQLIRWQVSGSVSSPIPTQGGYIARARSAARRGWPRGAPFAVNALRPRWFAQNGEIDWATSVFTWRRGFIRAVECTLTDWLRHGPAAVVETPTLSRVVLRGRRPVSEGAGGGHGWFNQSTQIVGPTSVPSRLFIHLPGHHPATAGYATKQDAFDALSAACLGWARAQAALPRVVPV